MNKDKKVTLKQLLKQAWFQNIIKGLKMMKQTIQLTIYKSNRIPISKDIVTQLLAT